MDASKCLVVALVLVIIASLFQVAGLASPYWIAAKITGQKFNSGIWKTCVDAPGNSACKDIPVITDWLKAVRAMSILGVLALVVAVVMTILKMFVMKDKNPILLVAIGTSFAGAVFISISIAVYAVKINDLYSYTDINYDFAFAFSVIGMIAAIGAGAAMVVEMVLFKK